MYYVKTKINEDSYITTTITDENVFTPCIDCGNEIPVDLYKHALKHRGEPWAEQLIADYLARKK